MTIDQAATQPGTPAHTPAEALGGLSPNRLAKRDQILTATVQLLLREGVHGCTARSIAAAAGVSKGAVHYYFTDVDEIVDLAMLEAIRSWIAWLRSDERVDPAHELTPIDRFWGAMSACLEPFSQGDRTLMPLWLEYWSICTRSRRLEPLRVAQGLLVEHVTDLLEAVDVDDARDRSVGVASYLFGTGMQQSILTIAPETIHEHIAALCDVEPPS